MDKSTKVAISLPVQFYIVDLLPLDNAEVECVNSVATWSQGLKTLGSADRALLKGF